VPKSAQLGAPDAARDRRAGPPRIVHLRSARPDARRTDAVHTIAPGPGRTGLEAFADHGAAGVATGGARAARSAAKRALDVVVAVAALLVLAPLLLVVALLIQLDSAGPVLYRAERVGYRGARLRMLKFRKMWVDATGPGLTAGRDPRFTRVGAVLAKLKLDELPQLWHVVRGEMSLVGPRPESIEFVRAFGNAYPEITSVRPGLIGLSQIAFARETGVLDTHDPVRHYLDTILPQKVGLDLLYVRQWSFTRDLRILAWGVVAVVFRQSVAVDRRTGTARRRRR
jgi:lipopolysaccharide/colanic/teichoic acid biosynthesis glycosyltransferase